MIKQLNILLLLAAFLISGAAMGEDSWKGEGELGFTSTSGNTTSQSLNAKLGISKSHDQWTHTASIEAIKASTNHVTSSDSKVFKEKTQYNFSENDYAFGKLHYEDDRFSGKDYTAYISFGLGSRFIQNESHTLDASLGIGYRTSKDTATQQTNDEGVVTADAKYEYIISPNASFSEAISVESGKDNTHSESETVLKTKINGNLSSKISYVVKHNSDVIPPIEKTDTITTVSLMYSF